MNKIERVGILGLGKMGGPMAKHLLANGFKVVGYDPSAVAIANAKKMELRLAGSAREVAAQSDVVIVVVGFDSEVEAVLFGADGVLAGAHPGLIVALGSTVAPRYAKRLGERLAERRMVLLDVPLTRGEAAAVTGKLLILGAGDETAFEACRPVFKSFASDIFHLGEAGAGQVAKMVNNSILWACMTANDEGLRLGEALGVDPEKLRKALHFSSAQNWSMDTRAEESGMPWAEKDMRILLHEADIARLALPVCGAVKEGIKALKIRMGLPMPDEKQ